MWKCEDVRMWRNGNIKVFLVVAAALHLPGETHKY